MTDPALGAFEVVRTLGQGGMGSVYEVRLPGDPRRLALKRIHVTNERTVERFRREGEVVARLDHPNIVAVRAAGLLPDDSPYLLFDLVEGRTVHEELRERGWLAETRALDIAKQVASALAHAHERGVVHRDLKPANLLIGDDGRVLLADFGLAVAEDMERMTRTGQLVGTPMYFAPEQIRGQERIGPPTDVHAVGVLLYELLTGTPPFVGSGHTSLFEAILKRQPSTVRSERPEVSRELSDLISRCLKKDPAERYADGAALLEALERVGRGSGRRRLVLGGLLALSAAAVAAALALSPKPAAPESAARTAAADAEATPSRAPQPPTEPTPSAAPVGAVFCPRWRPPVGTSEDYLFRWYNKGGVAVYTLEWRATYAVERSSERRVVFKVTIRAVKGRMKSQMVRGHVDSTQPPRDAMQGMEPLRRMVGQSFRLDLDLARNSLRLRGADKVLAPSLAVTGTGLVARAALPDFWSDVGLRPMYGALLLHLPPKPVRPGDRWRLPLTGSPPETVVGVGVTATLSLVAELERADPAGGGRYRFSSAGRPKWRKTSSLLTPAIRSRYVVRGEAEWLADRPKQLTLVSELGPEEAPADLTRCSLTRLAD